MLSQGSASPRNKQIKQNGRFVPQASFYSQDINIWQFYFIGKIIAAYRPTVMNYMKLQPILIFFRKVLILSRYGRRCAALALPYLRSSELSSPLKRQYWSLVLGCVTW